MRHGDLSAVEDSPCVAVWTRIIGLELHPLRLFLDLYPIVPTPRLSNQGNIASGHVRSVFWEQDSIELYVKPVGEVRPSRPSEVPTATLAIPSAGVVSWRGLCPGGSRPRHPRSRGAEGGGSGHARTRSGSPGAAE